MEMTLALWAQMDCKNHVLDWGPAVLRNVAMATNFWDAICCNWLCVL